MLAKKMNKKIVFINAYCFHSANEDEKLEDLKTIILPIIKCKEPYIIAFRYFDLFQEKIRNWLYSIIENENICFIIFPYEKIEKIDARFRDNKIFEEIRLTLPKKENRKKVIEYIMSEFKKETKKMNIDLNYDSLDLDYASKQTKGLNFFKIKNFLWDLYNDAENYAKNKTLPGDKINVVINKNIFDKTLKPYKKNISKFDIDNDLADEESENTSHITSYCSIISILCVSSAIIYYLIKKKNTKKNISKSCLLL